MSSRCAPQVLYSCIASHRADMAETLAASDISLPPSIDVIGAALEVDDARALAIYLKGHRHMEGAATQAAAKRGKAAVMRSALALLADDL